MSIYKSGTMIANRYRVVRGPHENPNLKGGMGMVYICIDHLDILRPVALKTFQPQFLSNRNIRDRFLREGTTWVDLGQHPHIVQAYGVISTKHRLEVYLVLELIPSIEGKKDASLSSLLTDGPLPLEQCLLFALQVARGMKHATSKIPSLVHRDLKPGNILIGRDGRARITDFGLVQVMATDEGGKETARKQPDAKSTSRGNDAKSSHSAEGKSGWKVWNKVRAFFSGNPSEAVVPRQESEIDQNNEKGKSDKNSSASLSQKAEDLRARTQLTMAGQAVGTPAYMSRAQWLNEELDARADIYAFGCILQEMVTGQRAAPGKTIHELKQAHLTGQLRRLPHNVHSEVRILIENCLALNNTTGRLRAAESYSNWDQVERAVATTYFKTTGQQPPRALTSNQTTSIDKIAKGWSINSIGASYLDLSKYDTAISYFEKVVQIAQAERNEELEAAGLGGLGVAYRTSGNLQQAIGYYERSLTIERRIGNRAAEVGTLGNLGHVYRILRQYEQALKYYLESLIIARQTGDRKLEATALSDVATIYDRLGDDQRAIDYYQNSLKIAIQTGDRRGQGFFIGNLGVMYRKTGDFSRALSYSQKAVAIFREIGDRSAEANELSLQGGTYLIMKDPRNAVICWLDSLKIGEEIGNKLIIGNCSYKLARTLAEQDQLEQALHLAKRALEIYSQMGHSKWEKDAEDLFIEIKNVMESRQKLIQSGFEVFQRANSFDEMVKAVIEQPFMINRGFIIAVEKIIAEHVPQNFKQAYEKRLAWLRLIASTQK